MIRIACAVIVTAGSENFSDFREKPCLIGVCYLYRSGKRRCDICREYDISHSLFGKWVRQAENSGSLHEKDNRRPEQEELI